MTIASVVSVPGALDVSATTPVVSVEGLTKRFPVRRGLRQTLLHPWRTSSSTVVSGVSFTARAGEFFGLLGPNGAGKTTLLKMLSTLVLPDEGTASIDGYDVARDAEVVRTLVSPCLATERSVYFRLTARENLEVYADLQGVPRSERDSRVGEVLQAVSLTDTGEKLAGQFSSGMLQRLLIARALLTRPRLLLLDEPTRSLDPISAREFRRFLRDELAQQRGCAIILATHNAEEAFDLCDRVGVMNHGRLLASGSVDQVSREFLGVRYHLATTQPDHPAIRALELRGITLEDSARQRDEAGEWQHVILRMQPHHDAAEVLAHLAGHGLRISAFEPIRPSLADLIEGVVRQGEAS